MHLYYSVVDPYPAYRADLAELFAVELRRLGLQTEWFMDASSEQIGVEAVYAGQTVDKPLLGPAGVLWAPEKLRGLLALLSVSGYGGALALLLSGLGLQLLFFS